MFSKTLIAAATAGAFALASFHALADDDRRDDRRKDVKPITVKIIGFNDYHGTLQSPGTFGRTPRSRLRNARRSAALSFSRLTCAHESAEPEQRGRRRGRFHRRYRR